MQVESTKNSDTAVYNPDISSFIIYDARNFEFFKGKYPNLQEKEVKIADGFTDNYTLTTEYELKRILVKCAGIRFFCNVCRKII